MHSLVRTRWGRFFVDDMWWNGMAHSFPWVCSVQASIQLYSLCSCFTSFHHKFWGSIYVPVLDSCYRYFSGAVEVQAVRDRAIEGCPSRVTNRTSSSQNDSIVLLRHSCVILFGELRLVRRALIWYSVMKYVLLIGSLRNFIYEVLDHE